MFSMQATFVLLRQPDHCFHDMQVILLTPIALLLSNPHPENPRQLNARKMKVVPHITHLLIMVRPLGR